MSLRSTFIGLGAMGYPMAGHLNNSGLSQVSVWNRTHSKAQQWADEYNGTAVESLSQAVSQADIIFSCAGRDEDVEAIVFACEQIKPGAIWVDHTTTSYSLTQKLDAYLAKKQVAFLDAPVSGGEIGAINGALTIMVGGNAEILATHQKLLASYANTITHMGKVGSGQLTKMANQICITGVLQGLSEAIVFAEAQDMDVNTVLAAISGGAAQSWQMENRGQTMHQREFDFGFAIEWMIKDLGYCLDQAKHSGTTLPLAQQVYKKYQQLAAAGHSRKDTSALILNAHKPDD